MPGKWSAPLLQIWQILNITPFSLHFFNPQESDATLMKKNEIKKCCIRLQVTMMDIDFLQLLDFINILGTSSHFLIVLVPWYSDV